MERVLIVDDDVELCDLVAEYLRPEGFEVEAVHDGEAGLQRALSGEHVLVVLDIMLPGMSGLDVLRRLRAQSRIPVLILTARGEDVDRIVGLEIGADDYMAKPFNPRELVARVKAVLRRFERPLTPQLLKAGDIEIDTGAMTLAVRGKKIATTATEFRLLDYLARHPGRVFTRDQLLDAVWRDTQFVTPRSVDVYVRRIREKIERDPENPRMLKTVRGAGYRFEAAR